MKLSKPASGSRQFWVRFLGYGGSVLLVVVAFAVLALPLLEGGRSRQAAASDPANATQTAFPSGRPTYTGYPTPSVKASTPATRPSGGQGQSQGGGGNPVPGPTRGSFDGDNACPTTLAVYRYADHALQVIVRINGGGFVQAEVYLRGQDSVVKQDGYKDGKAHTLKFDGVPGDLVQKVRIRIIPASGLPQECLARAVR